MIYNSYFVTETRPSIAATVGRASFGPSVSYSSDNITIEPTPINPQGVKTCSGSKREIFPAVITTYCEDYIAILSWLDEEGKQASLPPQQRSSPATPDRFYISPPLTTLSRHVSDEDCSDHSGKDDFYSGGSDVHPWVDKLQELNEFYKSNGHFKVSSTKNRSLFQWVKRQRYQYKLAQMGKKSNISQDRIDMLDQIGFVWNAHLTAWNVKFKELEHFRATHGHCFVPRSYKGSSKLSTWIKRQRKHYREFIENQQSSLDAKRIEKLEKLGLVWDYYQGKEDSNGCVSSDEESS